MGLVAAVGGVLLQLGILGFTLHLAVSGRLRVGATIDQVICGWSGAPFGSSPAVA